MTVKTLYAPNYNSHPQIRQQCIDRRDRQFNNSWRFQILTFNNDHNNYEEDKQENIKVKQQYKQARPPS